ncbi:Dimeric dUTPase, all-alpha-NTP-PPase (MazG) superfamily [Alteribacillus persepolensis]|uniref:Dimeric dUTPase, all-alpha-NTP-PPase (MazG) superfamily n=1 Tax=Alteribacillus persepolensis TaxID=568899 RepID=A0A1G8BLG5_9BACI|nr:dUTP diphosphatase [Alteribacillus persepolensis]SDH34047.1 Dimeric dUTPase, all-alpha-NTP-PPase (MazG) superfamily [Alteribacillus persepolensis]
MKQLFSIQRRLDERILQEHQLEREMIFSDKLLALQVEVGELANETRCFKYWSKKPSAERSIILEEYVDGLHFILSLGIDKGWEEVPEEIEDADSSLTAQFQTVYQYAADLAKCSEKQTYIRLFRAYLELGGLLGFSRQEIEEAYLLKNKTNHKRQTEGY